MVAYVTGRLNQEIRLDVPSSHMGFQGGVDGHGYSYDIGAADITQARLMPAEFSVPYAGTWEAFDKLLRQAEADVAEGKPGRIVVDGWSKRAYITGAEHKRHKAGLISTKLKVVCVDGAWWKLESQQFTPSSNSASDYGYLDYPMDFPYDYSQVANIAHAQVGGLLPCKPRIIFYGPVTDPYIIISGNKYQVTGSVPAGARVEIDGRAKTVVKILQDGTRTNEFPNALRGSGEGGGEYIFQPIPAGDNPVTWDGSFGVDVGYYREVGEVPWSQS